MLLTSFSKLAVKFFPGRVSPRARLVTSISVDGGFRSKTAFRELIETGTVRFLQRIAEVTAAQPRTIAAGFTSMISEGLASRVSVMSSNGLARSLRQMRGDTGGSYTRTRAFVNKRECQDEVKGD